MIIPFGWWHQEHPITNIANPESWSFNDNECRSYLLPEDEGISVEWDEDVLNDPNAVVIGRIEKVDDEKITIIDRLPERYHDYLDLFRPPTAEKLAPAVPSTTRSTLNPIPNHHGVQYTLYLRSG